MQKRKIIIYLDTIYQLGGIETWLYNLTSLLKDEFDFLVLWKNAHPAQLARLLVPHEEYDSHKVYYCDILLNIINGRPYAVRAKRILQVVHANYAEILATYRYSHWDRVSGFIFVSEAARQNFTYPLIGFENVVLTNPIYVPEGVHKVKTKHPEKLRLMAATRLTTEKGGSRLVQLVRQIHEAGIEVELHIWTNWTLDRFDKQYNLKELKPYFYFHETDLNLYQTMASMDYVVQLSDCESFCYTVHEALAVHTPVLVTDWCGVRDYVRNGLNGYIYDMEMGGHRPQELLKRPHVFGVASNENSEKWAKYLNRVGLSEGYIGEEFNYFLK